MPYLWLMYLLLLVFLLHTYRKAYGTRVYYFYKDTCPHCVKMQSTWDLFSSTCSWSMVVPVPIDCTNGNQNLRDDFGAETVPFIVKVKGDTREKYTGDRTTEDLLAWSKK